MAYRFKQSESLEKAARRISADQISRALPWLEGEQTPPESIHEVRKATKRLRALLRAVRPALPEKTFRARYAAAGEVAEMLSQARDNFILFETIEKLELCSGEDALPALRKFKELLTLQLRVDAAEIDPAIVAQAHDVLEKEVKKLSKIKLNARGMSKFFDGVEHVYGRGRRNLRKAYKSKDDEAFHDLRKATQWHWRHMALMSRCWPEYYSIRIAAGRELAQLLGDEHDLSVLRAVATARSAELGEAGRVIEGAAFKRQEALRRAVHGRAKRFFAEEPRVFRKRMEAYWRAGKNIEAIPELNVPTACNMTQPSAPKPLRSALRLAAKSPPDAPSQGSA